MNHQRLEPAQFQQAVDAAKQHFSLIHVIKAMGFSDDEANEAIRLSWCHLTPEVEWTAVAGRIQTLK